MGDIKLGNTNKTGIIDTSTDTPLEVSRRRGIICSQGAQSSLQMFESQKLIRSDLKINQISHFSYTSNLLDWRIGGMQVYFKLKHLSSFLPALSPSLFYNKRKSTICN